MKTILILGGARSGKSSFAELIANQLAAGKVIYLATGVAVDSAMVNRIKLHQQRRPENWQTIEEAYAVSNKLAELSSGSTVLLDCLTTYLSNLMLANEQLSYYDLENKLLSEVKALLNTAADRLNLIIVQNQVGNGIVPTSKMGRDFRDISGRAARLCAKAASEVFLIQAGLPMEIKARGLEIISQYSSNSTPAEVDVL